MRFTIRDLLWLMVVVGLVLGFYCERERKRYFEIAACDLESALHCLASSVSEHEGWDITCENGRMEVVLPEGRTPIRIDSTWSYPANHVFPMVPERKWTPEISN
jgi:hypothetical protein